MNPHVLLPLSYNARVAFRKKMPADEFAVNAAKIIARDVLMYTQRVNEKETALLTALSILNLSKIAIPENDGHYPSVHNRINPENNPFTQNDCLSFVENLNPNEILNAISTNYESSDDRTALMNTYANLTHWSAVLRVAYTHAFKVASASLSSSTEEVFVETFEKRMRQDLFCESVSNSFFMDVMTSNALKYTSLVVLAAGIAALALGICGLCATGAAPALLATLGVSSVALTTAGAIATGTSTVYLASRFFTHLKTESDQNSAVQITDELNQNTKPSAP